VWGAGFILIVVWAACSRTVTISSSGTASTMSGGGGKTTSATVTGSVSSGLTCMSMTSCPGPAYPGSACTMEEACCNYIQCDHMGGVNFYNVICHNGTWQSY